jgi:hypothetical protein
MKSKATIIELLLLIVAFVIFWLCVTWFTGRQILRPTYELNIHDTYFVLSWQTLILRPYLMTITLLYLIREGRQGYRRRTQNLILVIANALFIIELFPFFVVAGMMAGWNPELSISVVSASSLASQPASYQTVYWLIHFKLILLVILVVFMAILMITAILTGLNWKTGENSANNWPG